MKVYVDIDALSTRHLIQTSISDLVTITRSLDEANLIIGPSNRVYPLPNIKLSDSILPMLDQESTLAVVPFPITEEEMEYLREALEDLL